MPRLALALAALSRPLALGLLTPALLAGVALSQNTFTFPLDGLQSGTGSPGTGSVTVTLNPATGAVTADGTFGGMLGDALGVHIHGPAGPGEDAPVKIVLTFEGTTSGTIGGTGQHTVPNGVEDMLCGLYYILVHTSAVGGGELRGQVVTEPAATAYGSGLNPPNTLVSLSGPPTVASMLTLGLDNPTGSQAGPGTGFVFVTTAPDPLFAATGLGTPLAGFGMSGSAGELLISLLPASPLWSFPAPTWTTPGTPAPIALGVPDNKSLVGRTLYAQGVLYADSTFGLTNGLELHLGL